MGFEYNQLGEVCKSSKKTKGYKFIWEVTTILDRHCFCINNKKRAEKERLEGVEKTVEGKLWSVFAEED
jgi:hypothetical protein